MNGYQHGLFSMVYKIFTKKIFGGTIQNENISNKELAKELHTPILLEKLIKQNYTHLL